MSSEAVATPEARVGRVAFTGTRHELSLIILRGYALMIPTLGLYRFWQATWKRRFYWQNTVIDGEPLEYTGVAGQLLSGFVFALIFFIPIYAALFYFSMQESRVTLYGDLGVGAVLWFLAGYAIYRARDFRLSRTLWRGIRFDMRGSAWGYALLRFVWSVLMIPTAGLIYPWMGASLWRYRWRHSWYGDRRFEIAGNWRLFLVPYGIAYLTNVAAIVATIVWITTVRDYQTFGTATLPGPWGLTACVGCLVLFGLSLAWYRATITSRMLSTVTLGDARLEVKLRSGPLFAQFAAYAVALVLLLIVLAFAALLAIGSVYALAGTQGRTAGAAALELVQSGTWNVVLLIGLYLVVIGAFGLLSEVILGFGWWRLLASSTTVVNPDSIRAIHAIDEDRSVIGQGLAQALNVGAY